MVTLPPEFTATKFPGYFWNVETKKLYSIKVGGVLKELRLSHPNHFNLLDGPAYRVSHKGVRRNLMLEHLKKLPLVDSEIPVKRYVTLDLPF